MSKSIRAVLAIGLVVFVAACAAPEEEAVFIEDPITEEPAQNKI